MATRNFPPQKIKSTAKHKRWVKTFLSGVKSDLIGSQHSRTHTNFSKDETEALAILVKLHRNCVIVIKPCDKEAGIIIVDHDKYVKSCQKELESTTKTGANYFKKITPSVLTQAKQEIDDTLNQALNAKEISKAEFDTMSIKDKKPGKFY